MRMMKDCCGVVNVKDSLFDEEIPTDISILAQHIEEVETREATSEDAVF